MEITQKDDAPFPVREVGEGLRQGQPLDHGLLHRAVGQHVLQRQAALTGLALDGIHRSEGRLGLRDLLRLHAEGLRKLGERRLPAQLLDELRPGAGDFDGPLLERPADLDGPVVAEEAADLARDLGHGVGGKLRAEGRVIAGDRLEKADGAELKEVVRLHAPSEEASGHGPDQAGIILHEGGGGGLVPRVAAGDQLRGLQSGSPLPTSFFFIRTVVPRPGRERMERAFIKLSMMVMPMPERSAPPVVNIG